MAVTRARLNSYRADVDACGEAAATYVERYLAAITSGSPDAEVSEVREAAIEAIEDALNAFGDQAAELALDLFEEIVGAGHDAQIYDVIDPDAVDSKVRYYARDLVEGNVASFSCNVTDLTRYYVKRSAFENMAENCERGEVRYARVPSGRETCSFCYMLSSRGFVYHTEGTAGADHPYHRNCDCVIVPGYEGLDPDSQVEGYSPTEMWARWRGCAGTVGEDPDTRDETALGRIRAEVETHDWRWLNEGRVPSTTKERGAKPLEKERDVAAVLNDNGFAVEFIKEVNKSGFKTPDARLNGVVWEFKVPEGFNGENTIRNQFFKAKGKGTSKLVISCTENHAQASAVAEEVRKIFKTDDYSYIDEVLIVGDDGGLLRLKR